MAMTRRAAEKLVLSTHSLRFSTMAGVHAITATVTPWIRIILDQIKTVVKLTRMATVLEEDGLTQSILTTDTLRKMTTPISAATLMMVTVISNLDHKLMVMTRTPVEKLVMTTSSLLCKLMAGAAVVIPMAVHPISTLRQMTTSAETVMESL